MRRTSGSPATGSAALARTSDSGRSRVARPAVRTSAGIIRRANTMSAPSSPNCSRRVEEQPAIRVEDEVVRRAAERLRSSPGCACSPPSISTKVPTGVSSSAIVTSSAANSSRNFSIAEPDVQPELLEDVRAARRRRRRRFRAPRGSSSARLHRTLEGQQAPCPTRCECAARSRAGAASRRRCRSSASSWRRRQRSGAAPAARMAARASRDVSNRSLISRSIMSAHGKGLHPKKGSGLREQAPAASHGRLKPARAS